MATSRERIINKIWIKKTFFDNDKMFTSSANKIVDDLESAYEVWVAANDTIEKFGDNEEKRNQGFLSLKRAFNITTKALNKNLGLNNINYKESISKKKTLDILEDFEIIKTKTISKYLNIRNLIEHENLEPPSKEECLSLSEYIWNYIRNVSNVFANFSYEYVFEPLGDKGVIRFAYDVEKYTVIPHLYVNAVLKKEDISLKEIPDAIIIDNIKLMNTKDIKELPDFASYNLEELEYIVFKGEVLSHDVIANYIKYMVLPEYGGLSEYTIGEIF